MTDEREDWIGLVLGPWLVVEPFRNTRGKASYRCLNVKADKVVGITARKLSVTRNRMRREGIEPERVDVWTLAETQLRVRRDTELRQAIKAAPAFD